MLLVSRQIRLARFISFVQSPTVSTYLALQVCTARHILKGYYYKSSQSYQILELPQKLRGGGCCLVRSLPLDLGETNSDPNINCLSASHRRTLNIEHRTPLSLARPISPASPIQLLKYLVTPTAFSKVVVLA